MLSFEQTNTFFCKPNQKNESKCCLSQVQTPIEFIVKQNIELYKLTETMTKCECEMDYWNVLKGLNWQTNF